MWEMKRKGEGGEEECGLWGWVDEEEDQDRAVEGGW